MGSSVDTQYLCTWCLVQCRYVNSEQTVKYIIYPIPQLSHPTRGARVVSSGDGRVPAPPKVAEPTLLNLTTGYSAGTVHWVQLPIQWAQPLQARQGQLNVD